MKQHIVHFLVLVFILVWGIILFFYAQGNQPMQLAIGIITSVAYVFWGIVHHALQGDLHRKVVVEYVLIGIIAVLILSTILER